MLQFLPYAAAAYGGYKGYQNAKNAGASGIGRILGGALGAYGGYQLGTMVPGVTTNPNFIPFSQLSQKYPSMAFLPGQTPATGTGISAFQRPTIADVSNTSTGGTNIVKEADKRSMLEKLLYKKDETSEIDPLKLFAGVSGLSYLSGAFKQGPVDMYQPTYNIAYEEFAKQRPGYSFIDPQTGQEKEYEKVYIPEGKVEGSPYQMVKTRLRTGGLAEVVKKYNHGGINYLPSKVSHDENDANNYVRASGYVEDGSGNGDKDEDTMLAQLADGEFVTRADGVLGAGILAGANPNSMKDMREKGAAYFYEQQKRLKRIFDLLEKANEAKEKIN